MLSFLYQLIIMPLEMVIEVIFTVMYRMLDQAGLAIIGVSIVVSFLILPLYRRADAMQEEERDRQDAMKHWVDHIKRTFKGDEQYMLLTTYYRQMNYHPLYALKSSVSLLLQIPFFIAAYHYLSNLHTLQGASLGPIANLGAADAMLQIGGMTINVLPILMTVVNLISGAIYSRGFPLKTKLQQYGLTILFLVLLYNRPSGLVLYWTMNNVFSLVKNIFMKVLKHPMRDFAAISSVCGIVFLALIHGRINGRRGMAVVLLITLIMQLPLLYLLLRKFFPKTAHAVTKSVQAIPSSLFWLGGVALTLLSGVLIPMSVISNSPAEFFTVSAYVTPFRYIVSSVATCAGFFLLWFGIFYLLSAPKMRNIFALGYWIVSICSVINYMFFSQNFGELSTKLVFDEGISYTTKTMLINALVMVAAALFLWLVWRFRRSLVKSVYVILILGISVLSARSIINTNQYIAGIPDLTPASEGVEEEPEPIFRLSKTGKNVIVLMMDRMVSAYLPYIMNEKPELKEAFDGFTWYPNTTSFGVITNYGSPALFGGYEYTPTKMNARDQELLGDKQNELLKVMPLLFSDNGYEVTVTDPSYAGYKWVPDLSIYDEYPQIKAYNIATTGEYAYTLDSVFGEYYEQLQKHNFVFYSFFRMVPVIVQRSVYDGGRYLSSNTTETSQAFINNYSALCNLSNITEVTEEDQDTFLMMVNKTTHEKTMLQMPDYTPAPDVDNSEYYDESLYTLDGVTMKMENDVQMMHYCINMATFLKLGEWFDYMRETGVYDNTRIIIVSDHGAKYTHQFDYMLFKDVDVMAFNCMLMMKDFDDTGFETDNTFMTNADTTSLAMQDVIENPVNPFTGNEINMDGKYDNDGVQILTDSRNWKVKQNNGTTFNTSDGKWLSVHDDIFNEDNWAFVADGTEVLKEE